MGKQRRLAGRLSVALCVVGLAVLGVTASASAHTGIWARFNQCPSTTPGVFKCLQSVTNGGKVVLGNKSVPIVNPVTLQGGLSKGKFNEQEEVVQTFFAAANGETLSKTPQPVPGGLTGLVNCKEISNFLVRLGCEAVFENGLTGVNATLELSRPASEIVVSEQNLAFEFGRALSLPVKVHLENPLLGSTCYVGSSTSPIWWNLTTATTTPPAGTTPLKGSAGELKFLEEEKVTEFHGAKLVENNWAAPGATGCGGFGVELILDPIINASVGVPSPAGKNQAILESTNITVAQARDVNEH
jgi:hypothetical protein